MRAHVARAVSLPMSAARCIQRIASTIAIIAGPGLCAIVVVYLLEVFTVSSLSLISNVASLRLHVKVR